MNITDVEKVFNIVDELTRFSQYSIQESSIYGSDSVMVFA